MFKVKVTIFALLSLLIIGSLSVGINNNSSVSAQEIPYGGRLVAAFIDDVRTKCTAHSDYMYTMMGCILDQLIYDLTWSYYRLEDSEVIADPPAPRFFLDWEVSEDGQVWTVHIPKNATFHDGTPVTAEDIKFTADYYCRLPWNENMIYGLNRTEVVDDYTVRFYTNYPRAVPPMEWAQVLPKHIWEPYKDDMLSCPNEEMIGSGPFKFKEWKRGEYWWLEANENYWAGRPYVDEVVLKVYPSVEAAVLALKAGEVDMWGYGGVPVSVALDLMKDPNIKVEVSPGLGVLMMGVNVHPNKTDPLARDVRVRKAIAYGIDYDTIINLVYLGYGEKADSWIYPELPSHNPNLPQYEYNVTKANEILDEAGYLDTDGNGIRNWEGGEFIFDLYIRSEDPQRLRIAEIIKNSLKNIGIQINIRAVDYETLIDIIYNPQECIFDMFLFADEPGPNPEWIWDYCLSWEPESYNAAGWINEEFDELYYAALAEANLTKRDQIWWQMEELVAEELPYIFIARPYYLSPHRTDKFEGFLTAMGGISSWVFELTYLNVHLKHAPPTTPPTPTPSPTPWIITGICIAIAIGSIAYAAKIRSRTRKTSSS